MRRRIEILILLFVTLIATGCDRSPIEADKMEDILFDIYKTDACLVVDSRRLTPEQRVKYYDSIFEKHGVTKDEFDDALDWYSRHTSEWQLINESLEKRADEFVAKVENYEFSPAEKPVVQDTIDTLDLWIPKSNWEWREDDGEIDRKQTDYTWDDRKFFVGARNLRFEMKMRCWNGNAGDSVTTMMVLKYSKGANDTLRYRAPIDSVERKYRFNKMTRKLSVSMVRVMIIDTVENLKGVNVQDVHLNYAYNNKEESIGEREKREIILLRREVRTGRSMQQTSQPFVTKRGGMVFPEKKK